MKIIKYHLKNKINTGTQSDPVWEETQGAECFIQYSEANMAIAEDEAFGEVTVEDDGQPEPEALQSLESRVETLEADSAEAKEALEMILSGVTE